MNVLVREEVLSHFQDLFCTTENIQLPALTYGENPRLSEADCLSLLAPVTKEEVHVAVKSRKPFLFF